MGGNIEIQQSSEQNKVCVLFIKVTFTGHRAVDVLVRDKRCDRDRNHHQHNLDNHALDTSQSTTSRDTKL